MVAIIFARNAGDKWQQLFFFFLFSKMGTNGNTYILGEMLTITICRNVNNLDVLKSWKYDFPKCQQLQFPEILAIIISSFPKYCQLQISKCQQSYLLEMLAPNASNIFSKMATNANNYEFQKCWRLMITSIIFRNCDNKCQLL